MIQLKKPEEIAIIGAGGKILNRILKKAAAAVRPGINSSELEALVCRLIAEAGAHPAFKNYDMGDKVFFPTALCVSINNEIVHGPALPGRILRAGDIVGLDLGIEYPAEEKNIKIKNPYSFFGGFYSDMAVTVPVGKISPLAKKLIKVTKEALKIGISQAKPGKKFSNLGKKIEDFVKKNGFSVVRDLVGHGVGHNIHEDPEVFNYDFRVDEIEDYEIKPGMVFAIEPMVNVGGPEIKTGPDKMTISTADGSLSAHFEHTVAITEKGNIVLTK